MTTSLICFAVCFSVLLSMPAVAQSTETLDHLGSRPMRMQVAAGVVSPAANQHGNFAMQFRGRDGMALRADVWVLRTIEEQSWLYPAGTLSAVEHERKVTQTRVSLPIGVSFVFPFAVAPLRIEPSGGIGLVPLNQYDLKEVDAPSGGTKTTVYTETTSRASWYLSAGLTVRWRHVVAQQHLFQYFDGSGFLARLPHPTMIGVTW